jgi:hypothetical protein
MRVLLLRLACALRLAPRSLLNIHSECLINSKRVAVMVVEKESLLRFGSLMVIYYLFRTPIGCANVCQRRP